MKDKPYVIGLDLGGTNSVFGIVDKDAKIVSTVSVPTAGHGTADAYVKNCTAAIMPLIEEVGGITKIKAMGTTTLQFTSSVALSRAVLVTSPRRDHCLVSANPKCAEVRATGSLK